MLMKKLLKKIFSFLDVRVRKILFWVSFGALTLGVLWCAGALFRAFDFPWFVAWGGLIALLASLVVSILFHRVLWATLVLEMLIVLMFCCITPARRFRDITWQAPWQCMLEPNKLGDGRYELHNVRDFLYRAENDYDVRYRTVTVDPEKIVSIDVVFSHWDNLDEIAHSMLGLNFADGTTVVVSLETRLPEGAVQNGIDGLYRRYGLAMLAGTPEDLYGLRVDHRGEALYVYRLKMDHSTMRDMTVSIFERAAELQRKPEFYNSLCRNCSTGLQPMLPNKGRMLEGDIRVLLNGLAAKMLYEKGILACREGESFASLRARSLVPGLCCGRDAPPARYGGESDAVWLREHELSVPAAVETTPN